MKHGVLYWYSMPYSFSRSHLWLITRSYQYGCRECSSIGVISGMWEAE